MIVRERDGRYSIFLTHNDCAVLRSPSADYKLPTLEGYVLDDSGNLTDRRFVVGASTYIESFRQEERKSDAARPGGVNIVDLEGRTHIKLSLGGVIDRLPHLGLSNPIVDTYDGKNKARIFLQMA